MANVSVHQSCHSAGLYIKNERLRKPSYSFRNYLRTVVWKGVKDSSEQELQKRGQGPYIHTRKEAVSMTAKQIVSNNPKFLKVSLISSPIYFLSLAGSVFLALFWVNSRACKHCRNKPHMNGSEIFTGGHYHPKLCCFYAGTQTSANKWLKNQGMHVI